MKKLRYQELSDDMLVSHCLKEDRLAQHHLYKRYAGQMMTLCRRYFNQDQDAEDAFQEGFIRMFRKLHSYKSRGSFHAWLRRLMINVCLSKIKVLRKWQKVESDIEVGFSEEILSGFNEEELLRLIRDLPDGYRTIFNMYVMDGYSHKEIGKILRISASTSRSQLTKARKILRERIDDGNLS